ncbi:probable cytochrome c oxidase subunit 5C-1 [Actinidia eriantha]|uniref:probable cytochrome c oxidase subunit 5C-1 n=1 Tax=Actinidia eriantha TaxID=165200 RepID=UPI002590B406|nr:probable cytochrome c oxidase subunit 5C-1 [Actinidia eriantha]
MAGHKVAHAALKGPSVIKEIGLGIAFGLVAGGLWKTLQWEGQRKTRAFYDLLEKGEIRIVTEE